MNKNVTFALYFGNRGFFPGNAPLPVKTPGEGGYFFKVAMVTPFSPSP